MVITEEKALERILSYGFCDTAIPISIRQDIGYEAQITALPSLKKVALRLESDFQNKLFSKEAHSFLREKVRPFMDSIGFLDNRQSRKISFIMTREASKPVRPQYAVKLKDVSDYTKNLTSAPLRDLIELGHIVYAVIVDSRIVCVAYTDLPPNAKYVEVGVETAPEYRRMGYAKDCMSALICELSEMEKKPIYICSKTNLPSIKLAKSLEFVIQSIEYNYVFRRK